MAFPFKSEGVSGRPISHRRAKLSEVLSAKLARLARGSRVQRELADRVRLIFDPLEPRLLLNADLNVNLATDGVDIDHQILVRLIEEVENVNNVATTIQRVEIVDQARGGKVLAFGDLSTITGITISGGAGNDTLTIDEDSFGGLTLAPEISFSGGAGNDRIVFDSSDNTAWNLTGNNTGNLVGDKVKAKFDGVENLSGAHNNNDTFTIGAAGRLSGAIDGGYGGKDTIVFAGATATAIELGSAGSGKLTVGGQGLFFENMEPFNPGVAGHLTQDLSALVNAATNKNVAISASGGNLVVTIDGAATNIAAQTSLWLYLGDNANVTTISSLPAWANFSLMLDAGEEIVVNATLTAAGTLGLSAEDINIGASAVISAKSIDLKAIDHLRTSLGAAGSGATLSASSTTSATITIAGSLTATNGAVKVAARAANVLKMHGKADPALRNIVATLDNTATIALASTARLNGSSTAVSAKTDVDVDILLTEVPLPNFLGLGEITLPTDALNGILPASLINEVFPDGIINTGSEAFTNLIAVGQLSMDKLREVAANIADFSNAQVESDVTVTNKTAVTVDAAAQITQAGGAVGGSSEVAISASDESLVRVKIQTEKDALIPALATIVVFSAIDSDVDVSRTTEVVVGPATAAVVTKPTVINAAGDVAIAARNAGEVRNDIASNSIGSVTNDATETATALVRGVTVVAGGLNVTAESDTIYRASSLDAENRVTGGTTAGIDESAVTAGAGGVTVVAADRSEFEATALPFQPRMTETDAKAKKHIARVSSINEVTKTTAAVLSESVVTSAGAIVVSAINETKLSAFGLSLPMEEALEDSGDDPTNQVNAKKVNAGVLVANIVNGSTLATVSASNISTSNGGDIKVEAVDDTFLDATIYINIDGRGGVGRLLKGGAKAVTGLEAMNIVGFKVPGIAQATLDAILGTSFWTTEEQVQVKASITDSIVSAAGALLVAAASRGVVNSTVSNTSRAEATGLLKISAKAMGVVLATNQVSRLASAFIDGGTTNKSVKAAGAITVTASDDTTVNSNVKIVSSGIASSDGGLHSLERTIDGVLGSQVGGDRKLVDGLVVPVAYGTTVGLNYDTITDGFKGAINVKTGDVVAVAKLGEAGKLYKYIGTDQTINFKLNNPARNFDDPAYWQLIKGEPGQVYTYLGADNPTLNLLNVDFTDRDLWKPNTDYSIVTDKYNLRASGGAATGAALVFNDVRGGATALVRKVDLEAASLSVTAESIGRIEANADILSEAKGGSPFNQDKLIEKVAPKGAKGFLFKKFLSGGGTTKAQSAVVATNLIQGQTSAKIEDAKLGTDANKIGDVTVVAENSSHIVSENSTVATAANGNKASAFQISNNTIGWERGNLLFNTVETLLGDVVHNIAEPAGASDIRLRTENPFNVEASISNTDITSNGDVSVEAVSEAVISASIDNRATASYEALFDGKVTSTGAVISGNKVSSAAIAKISGGTVKADTVSVKAQDRAEIDVSTSLGVTAELDNTNGADIVNSIASNILDDYDYTTKSGTPSLNLGDKVRISSADDYAGTGDKGAIYQYMGADGTSVNLATANFNDFGLWKKLNTESLIPASMVKTGLLALGMDEKSVVGNATSKGGIFARNQVKSNVEASLIDTSVTTVGDVTVDAKESAKIKAVDNSVIDGWDSTAGISVSNTVQGGAKAGVENSSVIAGVSGDLNVSARTDATIDATALSKLTSSGKTIGFVIAFNAVGYEPGNLLFDAVDTLIGSPEIGKALKAESPVLTTAYIKNSSIDVGGDIALVAVNVAGIKSVLGAESLMEWENDFAAGAKYGVSGTAAGAILASNKVSAGASAYIDNSAAVDGSGNATKTVKAGGKVDIKADNAATISADIKVVATALPASTLNALTDLIGNAAERLGAGDYDFTTKSGVRSLEQGDKVRVALDYLDAEIDLDVVTDASAAVDIIKGDRVETGGKVYRYLGDTTITTRGGINVANAALWQEMDVNSGEVYEYIGETPLANVDLTDVDYGNILQWKQLRTSDFKDIFFPELGNIVTTNAKAIGLAIAYNDTRGNAHAYIQGAKVEAGGAVNVAATGASTITAYTTSTVTASGGSSINGTGKVLGFNGQIVTNVVLGKTIASIDSSNVKAGGNVTVTAENEARIDARLYSSGNSAATSVGISLAYNSVGWEAQNLLFNTLDTLVGAPYLADNAFDGNIGADATASILKSTVDAGGKIRVSAESDAQINATVSNAAVTDTSALKGASGASYGAIIAPNKVSGAAKATIDNSGTTGKTIKAANGVSVIADDAVGIYSNAKLVASTTVTNDGGAGIIQETLNDLFPADYDTRPDAGGTKIRDIKFGDRIRIADDYLGSIAIDLNNVLPPSKFPISNGDAIRFEGVGDDAGAIYQYNGDDAIIDLEALVAGGEANLGADWTKVGGNAGSIYIFMGSNALGQDIDLTQTDFTDLGLWKEAPEATVLLQELNLSASPSKAVGGLVVMNDVRGGSSATIANANVTATAGDVSVVALESAVMTAKVDSAISASGGSSVDWDGDKKTGAADTNPGTKHKPGSPADPAADTTPAGQENNTDKVLSINGTIATNLVQSSAVAKISGSIVTAGGDVSISAENVSRIDADTKSSAYTTGGDSVGVTLAFNTIGWNPTNVLFNGVDALLGDDLIADAFGGRNPSFTEAAIVDSGISAGGNLSVTADNRASIDAEVGNEVTSESTSISGTDGKAIGFVIASNKVASEAKAYIDNSGNATADIDAVGVTVKATDDATITSKGEIKALTLIKNDYGISVVANLAKSAFGNYQFTTRSGSQTVNNGDLIYIDTSIPGGPQAGELWEFDGADGSTINFDNFTGAGWSKYIVNDVIDFINDNLVPSLAGGSAIGVGALVIRNDIDSGATAKLLNADVNATGNVLVSAKQTSEIIADVKARVEVTGSAKGKSIAINGVIATNNVLNYAKATVTGSEVSGADLDVLAEGGATIKATIDADTIAKQVAAGITLAFNTVGLAGQNFLFNTVDTLLGTDLVGAISGLDPNAQIQALVTSSKIDMTGDVLVSAKASQVITSEISNYVKTLRGGAPTAVSVGGVFALNRVYAVVEASVTSSADIDADGSFTVSATNTSSITSKVVAPVIAINYTYGQNPDGKSVSIAPVVSRNAIDARVKASIDGVTDLDAASVRVEATQAGKIDATAAAAAVSVAVGTGKGLAVGVAGTIAFNTIVGGVEALISASDVNASGNAAGDGVTVSATNSADIDATIAAAAASIAGGFSGSGTAVAVGIVLAFNYIGYTGSITQAGVAKPLKTDARISNATVTGNKVSVLATSSQTIDATTVAASVAIGLAGSGGATAFSAGGVFVQNSIAADTIAAIDGGTGGHSSITARSGGIVVDAKNLSKIKSLSAAATIAASFSSKNAVAVSIGLDIAFNDIKGSVAAKVNDATLSSDGAIVVDAENKAEVQAIAVAASASVTISGGRSISFSGAGATAKNEIDVDTEASISNSVITKSGAITVEASAEQKITATVLAASAGVGIGSTGIGASIGVAVAINKIGNGAGDRSKVLAFIKDSAVKSSGALSVTALSSQDIDAIVAAGSVAIAGGSTGVAASGAGAGASNVISVATQAYIDGDGTTDVGQGVTAGVNAASMLITAEDKSDISAFVGAASIGFAVGSTGVSVSIGLSYAENTISNDIYAGIRNANDEVKATSSSLVIRAKDSSKIKTESVAASFAAGIGSTGIAISGAGAVAKNTIDTDTNAVIFNSQVNGRAQ
ncbi:LEPR-XLL domain-containing protein (plasmid) [Aminobacter sp. UC22_36]|uniref:LEPR-XLL domain-containing protein n=1 Tax=Aminobacter sp. UC22_36 TaxID=3374549 RepID=UPI0037584CF7